MCSLELLTLSLSLFLNYVAGNYKIVKGMLNKTSFLLTANKLLKCESDIRIH